MTHLGTLRLYLRPTPTSFLSFLGPRNLNFFKKKELKKNWRDWKSSTLLYTGLGDTRGIESTYYTNREEERGWGNYHQHHTRILIHVSGHIFMIHLIHTHTPCVCVYTSTHTRLYQVKTTYGTTEGVLSDPISSPCPRVLIPQWCSKGYGRLVDVHVPGDSSPHLQWTPQKFQVTVSPSFISSTVHYLPP